MNPNIPPSLPDKKLEDSREENKERWHKKGLEELERLSIPPVLKDKIRESLETPQLGPYHNEGDEMSSHLGLMMENIDAILDGTFDFGRCGIPKEYEDDAIEQIRGALRANATEMRIYAYLHDLEKMGCMNVEYFKDGKKEQRRFTQEEWSAIKEKCANDPVKIKEWFSSQGITKVGYRITKAIAEQEGTKERDHGETATETLRKMAESNKDVATFLQGLDLILKGVENHELHFQVFNSARSAKQYAAHLSDIFSLEEIDFIYAACFIDIASSLDAGGEGSYKGFQNMLIARNAHKKIQQFIKDFQKQYEKSLSENDINSLMNVEGIDKVEEKIRALEKQERLKDVMLSEGDVGEIVNHFTAWKVSENDQNIFRDVLHGLVGEKNVVSVLGQRLPNPLKRYMGQIKEYMENKYL